jgi:hypothetical protein
VAEYRDREHFIPITKRDLVELLCRQARLAPAGLEMFRRLAHRLEATLHAEYYARLEELKDAYSLFDPDADTQRLEPVTAEERRRRCDVLFEAFTSLLERANYRRLSQGDVTEALAAASDWGLNLEVDFTLFERLEIFARGDVIGRRSRRRWQSLFRFEEVPVPIYRRLVVMLRLRDFGGTPSPIDTESVYIKIFKDIPKVDLEMLLPGTRVRMSLVDRGRIVLPTLSGLGMALWKLLGGAFSLALSGAYNSLTFLGLVGGTLGYGVRSFYGYMQTKQKYQLSLTQSLYYQNLDNNAGALFRLLNDAEEQEFREAILAYAFLLAQPGEAGCRREDLDDAIEQLLDAAAGVRVDFEISDAVDKLQRLLLVRRREDGLLQAVPLEEGLAALDAAWNRALCEFSGEASSSPGLRRSA